MVRRSRNPGDIYVVTDDRELRHSVKLNGANVLFVKEFIGREKGGKKIENTDKKIEREDGAMITGEMEKIWLRSIKCQKTTR
jgi:hypothetical protein